MLALGLRRTIVLILAAALLSSQLAATVPGVCCCSGSVAAAEVPPCCVDSCDAEVPRCCTTQKEGRPCCCPQKCGESSSKSSRCVCDCSDSNEEQAPADENKPVRVGEKLPLGVVNYSWRSSDQRGCLAPCDSDSGVVDRRISVQILFCVWLI